jgi:hypothetical protein
VSTYTPTKVSGPFSRWCAGETWTAPSVTINTVVDGEAEPPADTPVENGEVHSINEVITVPAGTFTTVLYTITIASGDAAGTAVTTWVDVETGVPVKQEARDPMGLLTLFLNLTDIDLP